MSRSIRTIVSLPSALLLMAMGTFDSCGDDPSPGIQGSLYILEGNNQTGQTNQQLSQRLLVQFTGVGSSFGLGDVEVEWTVLTGGGSFAGSSSRTSTSGTAFAEWILGSVAGPQTAQARIPGSDPELVVVFTATAIGGSTLVCTNPQVFQDNFDELRSWIDTVYASSGNVIGSVTHESSGGNLGGYRRMTHHFPGGEQFISVRHIFIEDGYYTPGEQGAVDHLRVTEDRIKFAPAGSGQIGTGFIVRKNNVDHVALLTGGVFSSTTWDRVLVDLHGDDFQPPVDLSTGSYQFGYLRSNSTGGALDLVHGIDNWKVEVCRE